MSYIGTYVSRLTGAQVLAYARLEADGWTVRTAAFYADGAVTVYARRRRQGASWRIDVDGVVYL